MTHRYLDSDTAAESLCVGIPNAKSKQPDKLRSKHGTSTSKTLVSHAIGTDDPGEVYPSKSCGAGVWHRHVTGGCATGFQAKLA
jgi:hypothetical protein